MRAHVFGPPPPASLAPVLLFVGGGGGQDAIQRLTTYDRIEAAARCAGLVHVQWQVWNYKRNLQRTLLPASAPGAKENAILRKALLKREKELHDKLHKERASHRFRRQLKAQLKARKAARKLDARALEDRKREKAAALEAIPYDFTPITCQKGGYGKSPLQIRRACLQRLPYCCPELPLELKARYPDIVAWYADPIPLNHLER